MPRAIADAQLPELLDLIHGADSVELKLTIAEHEQRSAIKTLGMDPLEAEIRQVYFFDTPDLRLNRAGLVVRARRTQRKGGDTVVKLRPVVPDQLSQSLRAAAGFGVEVDAMPGGFVCSASMKGATENAAVTDAVGGGRPLRKMFSKPQRAFFRDQAPKDVTLDDLAVLGPIFVLKLRFKPADLGRKLVAEVWLYPDDSRILELSTKCPPADAFTAAAESRAYLAQNGIDLDGEQETKTRRALEFFSARV